MSTLWYDTLQYSNREIGTWTLAEALEEYITDSCRDRIDFVT